MVKRKNLNTLGSHYRIILEIQGRKAMDVLPAQKSIPLHLLKVHKVSVPGPWAGNPLEHVLFLEDAQGDLCYYEDVMMVH